MDYITLNNGMKLPQLGLGTYGMSQDILINTCKNAVSLGYRLFDTSDNYKNDISLGRAIHELDIDRRELLISTKIDNRYQKEGNIGEALDKILDRMQLDYIDMWLIHWPYPDRFINTWLEMENLYQKGKVKAIGVCNFNIKHLDELLKYASIIPAINQIEIHPLFNQKELVEYGQSKGIHTMSYSPLARMDQKLISHPSIIEISKNYKKTVPQIILKWNIQNHFCVIPKTENPERLYENIDIFDFQLSAHDMSILNSLDENYRVRFDPEDMSRYH